MTLVMHDASTISSLAQLANASYNSSHGGADAELAHLGYQTDKELSTNSRRVFHKVADTDANRDLHQTFVSYRGTHRKSLRDHIENLGDVLGFHKVSGAHKNNVYHMRAVAEKYGNVAVVGHSKGGLAAQSIGRAFNVPSYTFNSHTSLLTDNRQSKQSHHYVTADDPVAYWGRVLPWKTHYMPTRYKRDPHALKNFIL
eukprot:jgi/Chrzof1/15268/UNPLg00665.t1